MPALLDLRPFGLEPRQLRAQLLEPAGARPHPAALRLPGGPLALEDRDLQLQAVDLADGVLDRRRRAVVPDGDAGAGGVEQADRLVGQLAARDVAVREADGVADRLVEHAHAVVLLQVDGEAAHHADRRRLARLLDLDHLEAAGERRVLLEVLLVLGPGGGGDGAQLAAGQGGLEQVGGVPLAGRAAGADHRVRLVDEQDDRLRRRLDLVDHRLQPVLELPLDPGPGLEQAEVERAERDVAERRRHVAGGDAQGEPLDDGRLADAGLAGQDRVVLPPPDEDVDHLADLGVAAEDRIDLPGAGARGEVDRELVERGGRRKLPQRSLAAGRRLDGVSRRDWRGRRRRLPDAHVLDRPAEQLAGVLPQWIAGDLPQRRHGLQDHPAERVVVEQGEEQRAGAHRRGAELERGREPRLAEELQDLRREGRRARVPGIEPGEGLLHLGDQEGAVEPVLPQGPPQIRVLAVGERQQLGQQVLDLDVVMGPRYAQPSRLFQRAAAEWAQLVDEGLQIEAQRRDPPGWMKRNGVEDLSRKRASKTSYPNKRSPRTLCLTPLWYLPQDFHRGLRRCLFPFLLRSIYPSDPG